MKTATTIPAISFDFGSVVAFASSRQGTVGSLPGAHPRQSFPVSFRGAFASGVLVITSTPN